MEREVDVVLADGGSAHIRPIRPTDASALEAMHSRLSERTRYLRFFSSYPRIPKRDLRHFVNVDHRDREAFVALVGEDLIAVGRYERVAPGGPDAEIAFAVEDAHQGRGIAPVLLQLLVGAAREAGVVRFIAEVLPSNTAMIRVLDNAGFAMEHEYADGIVHIAFPIAAAD